MKYRNLASDPLTWGKLIFLQDLAQWWCKTVCPCRSLRRWEWSWCSPWFPGRGVGPVLGPVLAPLEPSRQSWQQLGAWRRGWEPAQRPRRKQQGSLHTMGMDTKLVNLFLLLMQATYHWFVGVSMTKVAWELDSPYSSDALGSIFEPRSISTHTTSLSRWLPPFWWKQIIFQVRLFF